MTRALEADLAAVIARHECTGREFVEAALHCAAGYFEDVPQLIDVQEFADGLREALRGGACAKPIIEARAREREHAGRPKADAEPSLNSDEVPVRTDTEIASLGRSCVPGTGRAVSFQR